MRPGRAAAEHVPRLDWEGENAPMNLAVFDIDGTLVGSSSASRR